MNEQAAAKGVNEGADCFSRSLSDLSLVEAPCRPRVGFRGGREADSSAARHLIDLRSSLGSLQGYVLTVVVALGLPFTPPAVRAAA